MNAILHLPFAERPDHTVPRANHALRRTAAPLPKPDRRFSWLENLSALGARCVLILAADRPEQIRALVGDGSRWGLQVEVLTESCELTADEARIKYCPDPSRCLPQPLDVSVMDHFPGLPEHPLFKSYANWFDGLLALMLCATASKRSDARESETFGVWVSARARVSPGAELRAPCWIGPYTVIAADTVIGPMAVIDDRVMLVEPRVEIANSSVAPETFVGRLAELKNSIADGSILINWRSASCTRVPDAFLLCSLAKRRHTIKSSNLFARLLALFVMILTLPLAISCPSFWPRPASNPPSSPTSPSAPFHSTSNAWHPHGHAGFP